jgi:WhiB family redox-sensing transcriptional regulator
MTHHTGAVPDTEPARAWLQHAACRASGVKPDTFFPDNNVHGIAAARRICATCPVWRMCLADCLRHEGGRSSLSRWGVYAGLTPRQRVRLYVKLRDAGRRP